MHGAATQLNETTTTLTPTPTNAHHRRHQDHRLYMLGSAAIRFSVCAGGAGGAVGGSTRLICRHPSSATARDASSSFSLASASTSASAAYHSSNCLLANQGSIGGTIWHSLLPSSSYLAIGPDKKTLTASSPPASSSRNLVVPASASNRSGGLALTSGIVLNGRFIGNGSGFSDGSWNVAWDARPARWLHGRHSAWLLFGFCSCFSTNGTVACCDATSSSSPSSSSYNSPALAPAPQTGDPEQETQVKVVYNDFKVIGIPGDGRCLFRAVAHGICTRNGKPTNEEDAQRELADDLRSKVVDELVKRRSETEWFIEGNFDEYAERMRESHVWGGEPELLMLSHVLKVPITVYMTDRNSNGVIAIAEYGQEYANDEERPVRVLYHGFGHYDALHMPGDNAESLQSKL